MNATARRILPTDFERLLRLYAKFEPKAVFHGLPPMEWSETGKWLKQLNLDSEQFVSEVGDRIVGHAYLKVAPDKPEAEMGVFIHQDFRGFGLGRALVLGMLNYGCKEMHLKRVWIRVDNSHPFVREVLERIGFYARDLNEVFRMELEMERPSSCEHCRGEKCLVFNAPLPHIVSVPRLATAYPERPGPYLSMKKSRNP